MNEPTGPAALRTGAAACFVSGIYRLMRFSGLEIEK